MKITNPAFGDIEFAEKDLISFAEGMLGLPALKRYILIQNPETQPFLRLQCVDEPRVSFLVIDPGYFDDGFKDYVLSREPDPDLIGPQDQIVLLAVCKITEDGSDVTGNLQAPVIINHSTMKGYQIVLLDSPYSVRHSLAERAAGKEA